MVREDDDMDVDSIAEGTDEDVAAAAEGPAAGGIAGFFQKIRGQWTKILGYALAAIIIIIVSVVISYFITQQVNQQQKMMAMGEELKEKEDALATLDMGDFRINLADRTETHIISCKLSVAYDPENGPLISELSKRRDQVRHIINMTLSELKKNEIDGPDGKQRVIYMLKDRINSVLQYGEVEDIYFDNFYVQ